MAIRKYIKDGKTLYEVYLNGRNSQGKRVQRKRPGIKSLRKAQVLEFELKLELTRLKEEAIPYRWHEWVDECLRQMQVTKAPSTVRSYETRLRKWITPHWKHLELSEITKNLVSETLFYKIDPELSPHSRKTVLKLVKRVLQMAVEEGILDRNPCIGIRVKVPEVDQKVLTNQEVEIFLTAAKEAEHRFFPAWFVALKTGMRSGELMALCWTDVDMEAKTISVSKQWTSKTGFAPTKTQRSRVVPISDDLLNFLRELKISSETEFVLPRLKEWEYGEQAKVTREFCQALGITVVRFHDLRATFITNLLARGVPLAQVMAIVGHTQLKTTNGYLRKAGIELKGVTNQLGYQMPEVNHRSKVIPLKLS